MNILRSRRSRILFSKSSVFKNNDKISFGPYDSAKLQFTLEEIRARYPQKIYCFHFKMVQTEPPKGNEIDSMFFYVDRKSQTTITLSKLGHNLVKKFHHEKMTGYASKDGIERTFTEEKVYELEAEPAESMTKSKEAFVVPPPPPLPAQPTTAPKEIEMDQKPEVILKAFPPKPQRRHEVVEVAIVESLVEVKCIPESEENPTEDLESEKGSLKINSPLQATDEQH